MFKRLALLLTATALCVCAAAAAESLEDFPLIASQSPIQLTDHIPLTALEVIGNGPQDTLTSLFSVTAVETGSDGVYLVLDCAASDKSSLVATMTVQIGGYISETVGGALAQSPSGQEAIRFPVRDALSVRVSGFSLALSNDDGTVAVAYDDALAVTRQSLSVPVSEMTTTFEFDGEGRLLHTIMQDDAVYDATYELSGELSYALITTSSPERIYYYEGAALSTIRDDDHGIIAYYDADTGMLMHYTVSSPVEGSPGIQRVTFSPYGDVIEIAYPHQADDWAMSYAFWSPNFGWHLADEENMDLIFALDAAELPDPESLIPPLPAAEKPEYRTDIRSVADLPRLPVTIADLPEVLDLQVSEGIATVTLSRSLTMLNAIPAIRARWNPDDTVIAASPTSADGVYAAEVADGLAADDLCFDIFLPAEDLSHFAYGYAYDPRTRSWQITVFSPAAEFVVDCTPEGRPVTAELVDFLAGETDHAILTFDEETGALTSYDYYLELPFIHRGGWYIFTYLPGRGVASAICGDRSTGRFFWTPEEGWVDLVLGTAPDDLLDPLTFPFPYPFPQDP